VEDELIIELFFSRSEQAVSETRIKYGCMKRFRRQFPIRIRNSRALMQLRMQLDSN
jgi:hypothetical protein